MSPFEERPRGFFKESQYRVALGNDGVCRSDTSARLLIKQNTVSRFACRSTLTEDERLFFAVYLLHVI